MVMTPINPLDPMTGTAHELSTLAVLASPLRYAQRGLRSTSSSTTTCSVTEARPTGPLVDPKGTSTHSAGSRGGRPRLAAQRRRSPSLKWIDRHLLLSAAPSDERITERLEDGSVYASWSTRPW